MKNVVVISNILNYLIIRSRYLVCEVRQDRQYKEDNIQVGPGPSASVDEATGRRPGATGGGECWGFLVWSLITRSRGRGNNSRLRLQDFVEFIIEILSDLGLFRGKLWRDNNSQDRQTDRQTTHRKALPPPLPDQWSSWRYSDMFQSPQVAVA